MSRTLLERQSELPRSVPLFRYVPERAPFSWREWDPATVQSTGDLPQYLILGGLDRASFSRSTSGWSARWQGTETDTHFDVAHKADEGRWEVRQTWRGLRGGISIYPTRVPLDKVIGQALCAPFPQEWSRVAKEHFEAEYQVTVIEQSGGDYHFVGIPDGPFLTIAFPIAVPDLRRARELLRERIVGSGTAYPISVEAKLIFQAINYVEGKAPEWTTQDTMVFNQSVIDTGLSPFGLPVREVTKGGSAAWTLRRYTYFLFVDVPFAGLTDFFRRMATPNWRIRAASDPGLRFELRPVIMPTALPWQTESIAFWDKARTTRSFLEFSPLRGVAPGSTFEQVVENEEVAAAALAQAEAISDEVTTAIARIVERETEGGGA